MHKFEGAFNGRLDYMKSMDILFNSLLQKYVSSSSLIIGHRIVHGGDKYFQPQLIDNDVLTTIDKYSQIAPLHNPFQLQCIQAIQKQCNDSNNLNS